MQLLVITWGKLFTRARGFDSNPAATVVFSAQGDQSVLINFNVFLHQSLRRNNCQHIAMLFSLKYAYSTLIKIIIGHSCWVLSGIWYLQMKNRVKLTVLNEELSWVNNGRFSCVHAAARYSKPFRAVDERVYLLVVTFITISNNSRTGLLQKKLAKYTTLNI